ncbi:MAG TPA: sigma-70 family RNA polymerase sigma factor [Nitrospirae bacterium]|nr:ECF RNA polymerase sigma-E factor [bacterium BMS3Abin06]HDH11846.1 sigma-70 family RNA polymerase sigma factor [Nitrospirota bacterium]HDZ02812.1 sigma-70 family RNA polymerase sigma factor [Nitrospirota bacterium]
MKEDLNLIEKYLAGNEEAVEMLVMKYQKMIYALACRMVNDMEEAKDITQKTFIQAIKSIKGFKKKASFKTWLYRIAVNTSLNHMRKDGHKEIELDESAIGNQSGALSLMIKRERENLIKKRLDELPKQQRLAIILRTYEGLSCCETSQIMGCSEGAVKAHYHFGVKKLKEILEGRRYDIHS